MPIDLEHDDNQWVDGLASQMGVSRDAMRLDVSSNYRKYGSFVVVVREKGMVAKVYRDRRRGEVGAAKFRFARDLSDTFAIPTVLGTADTDGRYVVWIEFIERLSEVPPLTALGYFHHLQDRVARLPVAADQRVMFSDYEFRDEFESLLPDTGQRVLTHGDINFKNVYRTHGGMAVIDWDNLSYQPKRVADAYMALMYLAHPLFRFEQAFTTAVKEIGRELGDTALRDAVRLAYLKRDLSVDPGHITMWGQIGDQLHDRHL